MIEVACAIIIREDRFFAAKRASNKPNGGLWEFPGGKIKPNENAFEAIVREIWEELSLIVEPTKSFFPESVEVHDENLVLRPIYCDIISGSLRLKDHSESRWVDFNDWQSLSWTEPDVLLLQSLTAGTEFAKTAF